MELNWVKCEDDVWCHLDRVDLESFEDVRGVYVIWNPEMDSHSTNVVRVGQGHINGRLADHRNDSEITDHGKDDLRVTWAAVKGQVNRRGIERYLADRLNPLVGSRFPDVTPIQVNLPGRKGT